MKASVAGTIFFVVLVIACTCAGAGSVPAENRLSIVQPRYSGQWKAHEITVEYSYTRDGDLMKLSGKVVFSYSMTMGYTALRDFRLTAVFLDENGRVLRQTGLVTGRETFDPIPFSSGIDLPPGAVSMAFGYQGKAVDMGREWSAFWFEPVH